MPNKKDGSLSTERSASAQPALTHNQGELTVARRLSSTVQTTVGIGVLSGCGIKISRIWTPRQLRLSRRFEKFTLATKPQASVQILLPLRVRDAESRHLHNSWRRKLVELSLVDVVIRAKQGEVAQTRGVVKVTPAMHQTTRRVIYLRGLASHPDDWPESTFSTVFHSPNPALDAVKTDVAQRLFPREYSFCTTLLMCV
jgi:hypothetical protein